MNNDTAVIKLRSASQIAIDKGHNELAERKDQLKYTLTIAQGMGLELDQAEVEAFHSLEKEMRGCLAELQRIEDYKVAAIEKVNRYRLQHQPCTNPTAIKEK